MNSEIFRSVKMGEDIVAMKKVHTMQQDREGILSFSGLIWSQVGGEWGFKATFSFNFVLYKVGMR